MANKPRAKLNFYEGYNLNFKKLREDAGLTLVELGNEIGFTDRVISMIETGERYPTIEQLNIYSEKFNVSLDYLTGRTKVSKSNIQQISEYTGLSEETIEKLSEIKSGKYDNKYITEVSGKDILVAINDLFTSENGVKYIIRLAKIKVNSVNGRFCCEELFDIMDVMYSILQEKDFVDEEGWDYRCDEILGSGDQDLISQYYGYMKALEDVLYIKDMFISENFDRKGLLPMDEYSDVLTMGRMLFDEPQIILEYENSKIINKIIDEIVAPSSYDKEYFCKYQKNINSKISKKIQEISLEESAVEIYEKEALAEFAARFKKKYKLYNKKK